MKFTKEQIENVLRGIYYGKISVRDLPVEMYYAIATYLNNGVYDGYGIVYDILLNHVDKGTATAAELIDYALLKELRENIYMFSAAKTYQQVREMSSLLTVGDEVRSFNDFKKEALKVYDQYNVDWLKAEYNTAIGQANMAVKWQNIIANQDILPYLEFSTAGHPCVICAPMEGIKAPVDSDIWKTKSPLIHYNCMCVLLQHADMVGLSSKVQLAKAEREMNRRMDPVFQSNPYFDKMIFNEDHPYFTSVPREDRKFAKKNFGLKIPKRDASI